MVALVKGNIEDSEQLASGNALEEDCRSWGWDIVSEKENKGSNSRFGLEKKEERSVVVYLGKHCSEESHKRCSAGKDTVPVQNVL